MEGPTKLRYLLITHGELENCNEREIDRINSDLEDTSANEKTRAIEQWIESILERFNHHKTEHKASVKEAMTILILELALWKAQLLDEKEEGHFLGRKQAPKKVKIDDELLENSRASHQGQAPR